MGVCGREGVFALLACAIVGFFFWCRTKRKWMDLFPLAGEVHFGHCLMA